MGILLALVAGCTSNGDDSTGGGDTYAPVIVPADFSTTIDNPYFPLPVGTTFVSMENGEEEVNVTVTSDTRVVMGVTTVVVHDVVTDKDKKVLEDTYDWYAQDSDGNVWYLGEDTTEYENGKLKTKEGSWQAGVDGALGGIIVPAHPEPGLTYREEYYEGHAEDSAEVLTLNAHAKVPHGNYDTLLQTRNFSSIEPDVVEEKFYAPGVGVVLEITVSGGTDRGELISFEQGA